MSRIIRVSLALLLVGTAACAGQAESETTTPATNEAATTGASDVTLQIISHHTYPVAVAVETGADREEIAVLGPHEVAAFKVPLRWLGGSKYLRLYARRSGSIRDAQRTTVEIKPGSKVHWTLDPNLAFSEATVD
jgi:hypothetical protein